MPPRPPRARLSPAAVQALARVSVAAGDLIRAERSRRKLTLRELAARAGVSAAAIAHVEAGHPASLETYARLATALEMRLELGLVDPWRGGAPAREAGRGPAARGGYGGAGRPSSPPSGPPRSCIRCDSAPRASRRSAPIRRTRSRPGGRASPRRRAGRAAWLSSPPLPPRR